MSKSFLLELREAASTSRNALTGKQLRDTADAIGAQIFRLVKTASIENMQVLNGLFAQGQRYLDIAASEKRPDPSGGQTAVLRRAVA